MTEYRAANYCVYCKLGPELHLGLEQRCPPLPDLHCPTCQCPKLHAQIPVPSNPMSHSRHDNGCQSADAALEQMSDTLVAHPVLATGYVLGSGFELMLTPLTAEEYKLQRARILQEAFEEAYPDAPQEMPELCIDGERVLTILDGEKPKTL